MENSLFWYLPVFISKCRYLPVNATGMENTRVCRQFANLGQKYIPVVHVETMSLREMGPQLKLPINVTKGSMPLQCSTYFPQIFAI